MRNEDPKNIQNVLGCFAQRNKEYDCHLTAAKVRAFWLEKYGDNARRYTGEVLFSGGHLTIKINSDAWRATLMMHRSDIKNNLNSLFQSEKILNLYFL
ncbi:MAG: DciA family protein [Flavobacteriales bacterium]|nr:DciA family protein [Flavobacteriales bacterium]